MSGLAIGLVVYALVVLTVGAIANRTSRRSAAEYYMAGRSLGTFVLFMALFGTNATTFVLVAIPARAYHDGVGVFSVNAPIIALGIPLSFWAIGAPARRMAKRLGALTPAELFARRLDSRAVGVALFVAFALFTLPYMVQAVKGVGIALAAATDQAVPLWLGALGVTVVALVYTMLGGMRATAWTNVIQGVVFLAFMLTAFVLVADSLGGLAAATDAVARVDPDLLRIPADPAPSSLFAPGMWASWGFVISATVIAFPHMFARLMAAESDATMKTSCMLYPVALAALWLPSVMLGVWGAAAFPGLEGAESDRIFSLMTGAHLPEWLGVVAVIAVLAAVMSTLDAQILTLSSMLVRDVLDRDRGDAPDALRTEDVRLGRWFSVGVAAIVYVLALTWGDSLFDISRLAFSGYTTLVPVLLLGVRWRGLTAAGALASIVVGVVVLAIGEAQGAPLGGVLPVTWAVLAATVAAVATSFVTSPPHDDVVERAFGR